MVLIFEIGTADLGVKMEKIPVVIKERFYVTTSLSDSWKAFTPLHTAWSYSWEIFTPVGSSVL